MKIIAEFHTHANGGVFAKIYNEHGGLINDTKAFADTADLKDSVRRLYPTSARRRQIEFKDLTNSPVSGPVTDPVTDQAQAVENVQEIAEEVQAVAENTTTDQETATSVPAQAMVEMPTAFMSDLSQAITDELLKQPPQITGFIQRGETVTIYFSNGKQRKTTADRLFNINKPSQAEATLKRVKQIVE